MKPSNVLDSKPAYNVFLHMAVNPDSTMRDIYKGIGKKRTTVFGHMQNLLEKKLVEKRTGKRSTQHFSVNFEGIKDIVYEEIVLKDFNISAKKFPKTLLEKIGFTEFIKWFFFGRIKKFAKGNS